MANISVRPFTDRDSPALAGLITELGYPSTAEQMKARMARIVQHPDYATFVAEVDGEVVGMVGVFVTLSHEHDEPVGRITGMVVRETNHGQGIGARLLAAAEDWVRQRGAMQMALTSHVRRSGAHAFYLRRGYAETGKRFVKKF